MATNHKNKGDSMQGCSIRLPQGTHAYFVDEAERRGTTVSDAIRTACERFREQQTLDEQLVQLEQRFFRKVFESHCAVAGLTASERDQALRDLKQQMQGGQL